MADITPNLLARDARFGPLAKLSERLGDIDPGGLLVYLVDTVKPDLLPLLAEQFHIDGDEGWLLTQTEQQRRDLIKQSIELHRHKGTPWALREVFRILGVTVELEEWWQRRPPAAPYTFELTAWANDNLLPGQALLNPDLYRRLRRMVELAKPARSTYRFKLGARFNGRLGLASAAQARALIRRSAEAAPMRPEPQQPLALSSAAQIYSVVHVTMEASL